MSTLMASLSETDMKQKRPISFLGMNVYQIRHKLTEQLDDKEKLLEKVGTSQISRNALIKQTDIIRKELLHLNQYSQEEELPVEIRSKLESLANEFQYLKSSKLDDSASAAHLSPLLPPPPTNSSPTKQRSKALNGNRRNPDIEFATEIGQGLLIEVRKLQQALQEKEEIIKQLELAKADNERTHETAQRHLKQKEEIEERLKEENWNLEVANQELRAHLSESNQSVAKHNSDYGRLAKQLKTQSEQIEIMKAQEEKSASVIEAMKARHEQETYHLRRHAATAQRENAQVQKQVEALNTELKIVKAKLAIKLATSSRTVDENTQNESQVEPSEDIDPDENNKTATPPTPAQPGTRSQQVLETETLKQSLAHAHRIISNLRSSLHKEKLEKFEYKKMLSDSQENIEQMRKEMASWNSNHAIPAGGNGAKANGRKKQVESKKRRGGVARQPRGLCPNESDTEEIENEVEVVESDEYDSAEEDTLDQQFTNYGNSFEFGNGTPFSSIAMKPLSSELEAKVQVIDAGMNTDPVDFVGPCVHGITQHDDASPASPSTLLVAVNQQDGNTRSNSSIVPQQQQVPINQEVTHNANGDTELLLHQQISSDSNNNKQIINNSGDIVSPSSSLDNIVSSNEEYVQEQVTKAIVKERKEIAERVGSILSRKQIETIILSPPPSVVYNNNLSSSSNNNSIDHVKINNNIIPIHEQEQVMVSKKQADQLIQSAVEKETAVMVHKDKVEKLIQEAVATEQEKVVCLNLIPKVEAEKMVEENVEEVTKKLKADTEVLVQETREKVTKQMKAETEVLVQETREEVTKQMKAETEVMVQETREKITKQMKAEAEVMVQEAREEVTKKMKAEAEVMVQETREEVTKQMKAEAEVMVQETREEVTKKMKAETEVLVQETREEITKKMKAEAEVLVQETREEITKKIKGESEVLVQETRDELNAQFKTNKKELLRNMIPKTEAEAMALAAAAVATEQVKNEKAQEEVTSFKSISPAVASEDMITKKEADKLVRLATAKEQVKIQQALDRQKAEIEAATLAIHKKELETHLENQKVEMDTIKKSELEKSLAELEATKKADLEKQLAELESAKKAELEKYLAEMESSKKTEFEKHLAELEAVKQAELEKHLAELEAFKQAELEKHLAEFEAVKKAELEKQRVEIEAIKQAELEKQRVEIEAVKQAELEKQRVEIEAVKQAELEKQKIDIETAKQAEFEKQKAEIESAKQAELEKQRLEVEATVRAELEKQIADIEATKQSELERQREDANAAKLAELVVLTKSIETYKKEYEETNQRMVMMLTKDSADVLVKKAVADALEKAEKNQAEVLAGMISREYAMVMVKDEVAKALDRERKEVAQCEEAEAIEMISKAEAKALAKVAAADAIVKERQAMAARENELVTKEEAEVLAAAAACEAVEKERTESALLLARERKLLREKEERMISKEEAEENTKEAVRLALLEKESKKVPNLTSTSHLNVASTGIQERRSSESPVPSKFMKKAAESSKSNSQQELPPTALERSVSTSRLAPPSLNISPAPSISTPATSSSRKLRLSSSVSSLRLGSGRKDSIQKNQRPSIDSTAPSFGSFRILENAKYASRLQSKSSISLRELSQKQESVTSISTISTDDGHYIQSGSRMHMPMSSDESFPGFSSGGSTDMYVISAITQTMIGEWMSKHTRRYVGGGISENKHQRFFWVHPYTKILYWSSIRPGAEGNEAKTKSAFIESVSTVPSHDSTGASPMSLLIRSPKRDLKITAPSLERHELWLKSLSYLLGRPGGANNQLVEESRLTTESSASENAGHQQSILSSKGSDKSISHVHDIVQYDSDDSEDLVNIRQCCDGKHDLSTLSKGSHHHHHS